MRRADIPGQHRDCTSGDLCRQRYVSPGPHRLGVFPLPESIFDELSSWTRGSWKFLELVDFGRTYETLHFEILFLGFCEGQRLMVLRLFWPRQYFPLSRGSSLLHRIRRP